MFKRGVKNPVRKVYIVVYDNMGNDKTVVYEGLEKPSKEEIAGLLCIPAWKIWEITEISEIKRIS